MDIAMVIWKPILLQEVNCIIWENLRNIVISIFTKTYYKREQKTNERTIIEITNTIHDVMTSSDTNY